MFEAEKKKKENVVPGSFEWFMIVFQDVDVICCTYSNHKNTNSINQLAEAIYFCLQKQTGAFN